ncbi:MAG: tetratricopeptide repeat protein [Candidatus Heimdallarchaeota archaeon]|nr:tetratricopeptide repeat protein [Candidatus Heimdallarchaeota archaeon]MBY8995070.1 tetratricopeptide repeat protein [Candidatus Heimdallarchaeota archaeon]
MNVNSSKADLYQEYKQTSQIEELEKRLVENGDNSSLIKKLADAHFREGNYLRALSCYLKLLSFDPENARTWNKLAVIFIKLEEHKSAVELSRIAHRLICKEMKDDCK